MIQAWLQLMWALARFRVGPEDFPDSRSFLYALVFFNILLTSFHLSYQFGIEESVIRAVPMVLLDLLYTFTLLYLKGYRARFIKTITALLSVSALIYTLMVPMVLAFPLVKALPTGALQSLIVIFFPLFVLVMHIWSIAVTAHIFRRSLEVSFVIGLLITIALLGLEVILFR